MLYQEIDALYEERELVVAKIDALTAGFYRSL
jgi:hypothetical protein